MIVWTVGNILLIKFGLPSFDPPPFTWLQGVLSLGALLQATMILITQNRQDIMIERGRQLDLQVSLLLDQKISRLITMADQLRRVHPALEEDADSRYILSTLNREKKVTSRKRERPSGSLLIEAIPLLKSPVNLCYPQLSLTLATQAKHDGGSIRRTKLDGQTPAIAVDPS